MLGSKCLFKLTQLQLSISTVHFLIAIFNPTYGFVHLTQIWLQTTQHFLECKRCFKDGHQFKWLVLKRLCFYTDQTLLALCLAQFIH